MKKIITAILACNLAYSYAQINLTPDSNFGNNSIVDLGSNLSRILSYRFFNDKIMIQNYDLTNPNFTYSRISMLNNDGSLYTNFGTGGSFLLPTSYNGNNDADFVHHLNSSYILMISGRKYLYNGTLDQTYGNNGQTQMYPEEIYRKVLPNGKLLIRTINNFYQYTSTGNLDTAFGNNGSVSTNNLLTNYYYPVFDYQDNFVPLNSDNSVLEYDGNYGTFRKMNYYTGNYDVNFGIDGNGQYSIGGSGTVMKFYVLSDHSSINYLFDSNNLNSKFLTRTLSTGMLDSALGNNGKIDLPENINGVNLLYNQDFAVVNESNYVIPVFDDSYPKKMYLANFNNNGLSTINSQNLLDTGITTAMVNPDDKVFISVKDGYLYLFVNPTIIKRYLISENVLSANETKVNAQLSFANPFKNELNLITDEKIKSVEMYDESGRMVLKKNTKKNIDTSDLEKGIYFIKVVTESNKVIYKKGIKN